MQNQKIRVYRYPRYVYNKIKLCEFYTDMKNLNQIFSGKSILITGGTGSFGRAFAKRLIETSDCRKVVIFSRDEWKQWEMQRSNPLFSNSKMRYFLGDVRDPMRLIRAFSEIDIIIHAAALKQVPAAEYNPSEFIKTNVVGGMNVIDAAISAGVEKVIALSTDKAVNPVNMYGATKLCSDKLFVAANSYVGSKGKPVFSVVRYGNVAGSRGSVIPLYNQLSKNHQSLPITDERMTRFWITLPEAVDLVIESLNIAKGGEIFVPKIPSFKITDLAKAFQPKGAYQVTGIREGEKLHELMISQDDARHTLDLGDFYVIVPEFIFQSKDLLKEFIKERKTKSVPAGFFYSSDTNPEWLKEKQLQDALHYVLRDENL